MKKRPLTYDEAQETLARRPPQTLAEVRELMEGLEDIPPCQFCGRVFLAGMCCPERATYEKERAKSEERAAIEARRKAKRERVVARRAERRAAANSVAGTQPENDKATIASSEGDDRCPTTLKPT